MRIILAVIAALVLSTGALHAQQKREHVPVAKAITVPAEYMELFDAYRDFKPEYEEEPYANSLINWGVHALNTVKLTGVTAIRNWLFTRGEERIRTLAIANKEDLKAMFGRQFNLRGMHVVFAEPYTMEINLKYEQWYDCIARSKAYKEMPVTSQLVLAHINWDPMRRFGMDNECQGDLEALSHLYGPSALSADDLTAIGFLSRRHAAHSKNGKFASAEFLRKLVHEIFDED